MIGGSKTAASVGKATTGAAPIPNSIAKLAATLVFAFSVIVQLLAMPLQAPLQPASPQPGAAVALSVTVLPRGSRALHVPPQLIPASEAVIIPLPTVDTDKAGCAVWNTA